VLTACNLTYLGLMAGRVLLHYKQHKDRLVFWTTWATVLLLVAGILCGFSQNGGIIPVNKNLWSPSFVFLAAGAGLVGLSCCYVLVDLYKWWSGAPFLYLGMNR
jgi:heparan-alpha-glucosaminide N-acetyltransferase